jgi:hypothetical protein
MAIETQAALEVARFIASHPSPERVIAFHLSPDVAERAYALIDAERVGTLTDEERQELESFLAIQHIMILAKAEARLQRC